MKVLWLCNVMLPVIAQEYGLEASNKEGWLSGLLDVMMENQKENQIQLAIAHPAPLHLFPKNEVMIKKGIQVREGNVTSYGFREDVVNPDRYDPKLEEDLKRITEDFEPDVIHCFGTEYPHTLAMCRTYPKKERLLITIQGLCAVYADSFYADLPERVIRRATFRDRLKKDSIPEQREKYVRRGEMEKESVALAGNIGGRTPWDRYYANKWHPEARYFLMGETLRSNFYEGRWEQEKHEPHSIFLSQGDYPIKGLHYMLLAMPRILEKYPDAHVYVAGNGITAYRTIKEKLKISSYGKYLREIMKEYDLEDKVTYLGRLSSKQMKDRYLKSSVFVCPSSIENSPNSLGEAMLLGMPCVASDVGGIPGIFEADRDGVVYQGHRPENDDFYDGISSTLEGNAAELANAVLQIWEDPEKTKKFCESARAHALKNHDRAENYRKTIQVYETIAAAET